MITPQEELLYRQVERLENELLAATIRNQKRMRHEKPH